MQSAAFIPIVVAVAAAQLATAKPTDVWKPSASSLRPFWRCQTMEGESVLFVRSEPGRPAAAALLFEPTRILSVTSASQEIAYEEGRDFTWQRGAKEITIPQGSKIVVKSLADLRRTPGSQRHALTHRDGNGEIMFGATHEYHDLQTVVSYEHRGVWAGPAASFAGQQLPRTIERLAHGRPLTIALLGDSISTGCNASGWAKVAPFQPPYQELLAMKLQAEYGAALTLHNFAVGGTDTAWGLANIGKVTDCDPDLVLLAFGMNDAASRPADEYQANIRQMIDTVREACPNAEFILVATMRGNADWTVLRHELFPQYRDALADLCGPGIVLADMTSVWTEMLRHKQDRDLTGNGVNHPNDFGHRVYAQVLLSLLIDDRD